MTVKTLVLQKDFCAINCPVIIDNDKLIKQLRVDQHSSLENSFATGVKAILRWL
jgi:hypothetical protein